MARSEPAGIYDPRFAAAARWLLARGVHPNHLTFLQSPVFLLQIFAAMQGTDGWRWVFVALIVLLIILDGGDGILARVGHLESRRGAVLDSTFDTLGIAIVMWGAARFYPEAQTWLMLLFLGNVFLYLQNALLDSKVIAYIRGPVLVAVAFPDALLGGLLVASIVTGWLLLTRVPASWRALGALSTTRPGA